MATQKRKPPPAAPHITKMDFPDDVPFDTDFKDYVTEQGGVGAQGPMDASFAGESATASSGGQGSAETANASNQQLETTMKEILEVLRDLPDQIYDTFMQE